MFKSQIKGVVFDLDGTLVDSLAVTFDAFNHGIQGCGGQRLAPEEIMRHFGMGEDEIFARIVGRERAQEAYALCRSYLDANMNRVPLHHGIRELLDTLRARGLPLSIVTGRSWNTTEVILRHHGLLDRFVTVVADDHVSSPKPSPEGLHLALGRMGIEPEAAVYVGDTWVDIRAARAAGSLGIAALWDLLANREEISKQDPDRYAESPAEILQIIWPE